MRFQWLLADPSPGESILLVPKPARYGLNLRGLLSYIVAKYKSYFSHGSRLVLVHARGTEDGTRRIAARMNPRKVSAKEEASVLKGGRQSDRRARAARTEHQIDSLLRRLPRTRDIFPAYGERKPVFESVIHRDRSARG